MFTKSKTVCLSILFISSLFYTLFGTNKVVWANHDRLEAETYRVAGALENALDAMGRQSSAKKRRLRRGYNLGDKVRSHRTIPENSFLESKDGRFKMVVQGDGNLVIYQQDKSIWASNTAGEGSPEFELAIQNDGNVVLYGRNGSIWATNTNSAGSGPYTLVMQNDGNLVLYDRKASIWQSGTCCR